MPSQTENNDALTTLYDTWQGMPWYQRWFFPRALGFQLTQYKNNPSPENERAAYDDFLDTWSIQRWFFSSLTEFANQPFPRLLDLVRTYSLKTKKSVKDNIDAVFAVKNGLDLVVYSNVLKWLRFSRDFDYIAKSLILLYQSKNIEVMAPIINTKSDLEQRDICVGFYDLLCEGILNDYQDLVAQSKEPFWLARSIIDLNKAGLCQNRANLDLFLKLTEAIHSDSDIHSIMLKVTKALIKLQDQGLLEGECGVANRESMSSISCYSIDEFTNALIYLHQLALLNDSTRALIVEQSKKDHFSLPNLSHNITALQQVGVFTQANGIDYIEAVVNRNVSYQDLPVIFELLDKHQLSTTENRQKIIEFTEEFDQNNYQKLEVFGRLLKQLSELNLLTGNLAQDNFDKVMNHPNKTELESLIVHAGPRYFKAILPDQTAQATFDKAIECPYPEGGAIALSWIMYAHLPRNEGRAATYYQELIVTHAHILLADPSVWERLPERALTRERYERIIAIAVEHADDIDVGRTAFRNYVDQVIAEHAQEWARAPDAQNLINAPQSTHTASVHRTVSEAAKKLVTRYATEITPDQLQKNMKLLSNWINNLPDENVENAAVQRCFNKLTGRYCYTDRVSNVSIKQLLALIWVAIHDDSVRKGSLDDAKSCLFQGLYEVQRGYNVSINGVDDGGGDASICLSGAFNKLMEKLWGIHPDVNLEYMTLETFKHKIIPVLNEQTDAWSAALSDELKNQLIIAENRSDFIWTNIKPRVEDLLFSEFGSLFQGDKNNAEFQKILDDWRQAYNFEERMSEILNPVSISEVPGTLFGPVSLDEEQGPASYEESKNCSNGP